MQFHNDTWGYSHLAAFVFTQGEAASQEMTEIRSVKAKGGVGVDVGIERKDRSMLTEKKIQCKLGGEQV